MVTSKLQKSSKSGIEAKKENMALLFVLMGIEHGADVMEFRKDGNDCRIAERIDDVFFEFPSGPEGIFEFMEFFYRSRFVLQGSEDSVIISILATNITLHFTFHSACFFSVAIEENNLKGRCMELIEPLWPVLQEAHHDG